MRYADSCCQYVEQYKPQHTYVFTGRCMVTGKPYSVTVPANELNAYRRGAFIQDAMPSVSKDDREFLISGTSPEGWKQLFSNKDSLSQLRKSTLLLLIATVSPGPVCSSK